MTIADVERVAAPHLGDERMQALREDLFAAFQRAGRAGLTQQEALDITFGFALGVMVQTYGAAATLEILPRTCSTMRNIVLLLASPEAQGTA